MSGSDRVKVIRAKTGTLGVDACIISGCIQVLPGIEGFTRLKGYLFTPKYNLKVKKLPLMYSVFLTGIQP